MPLSRIVVPVDFSARSEGAARYAEALQKAFSARITMVHVLPPPHYEFGAMEVGGTVLEELIAGRAQQVRADLDAFMAGELPPETADRIVREGDPAQEIVALAHELEAGLIVMPTHGYGPFRRFILGSVTAKVLHDADCPVWTGVHLEAPTLSCCRWSRIAVAIDLGQQSERTLMWASRFAGMANAEMALFHATPNLEGKAGEYFDPDWRTHIESSVREEVARLLDRLGIKAPMLIDSGDAAPTVCRLAGEWGAELLVIGRGSAAGVFGRLRANAYSILRQSHCPVVSV
jgi:nucleotide-binding universal stress UspA family protein